MTHTSGRLSAVLCLALACVSGCRLDALQIAGKACPCPATLDCDAASNTCVLPGTLDFAGAAPDLAPLSEDATLSALTATNGTLSPAFSPTVTSYTLEVPLAHDTFTLTATPSDARAKLTLNHIALATATASDPMDATGAPTPAKLVVTAPSGHVVSYTIVVTRARLLGQGTGATSVALDGDTLVVGALGEASCATGVNGDETGTGCADAGAVHVYRWDGSAFAHEAYLKPSYTQATQYFGRAVAISGDTIAVGAPFDPSCATGIDGDAASSDCSTAGAAYVFHREGTTWSQEAYLKPRAMSASSLARAEMGSSVSISGDRLAVGAPFDNSCMVGIAAVPPAANDAGCASSGAAYIYSRSQGTWSLDAYARPSLSAASSAFGYAVALAGTTLVVGAPYEDACGTGVDGVDAGFGCVGAGSVYVFDKSDSWTQSHVVKPAIVTNRMAFGSALALDSATLAVGAFGEASCEGGIDPTPLTTSCEASGAAFGFARVADTFAQTVYLKESNPRSGDSFGDTVAVAMGAIAVGASQEDSSAVGVNAPSTGYAQHYSGAVFLFVPSPSFSETEYLKAPDSATLNLFGSGVALSPTWLVVSDPGRPATTTDPGGAVWVYSR